MGKNAVDTSLIDPNLSSYDKFFDHEWARGIFESVNETPLEDAVYSLLLAWRSANGAHILPWLMANSLRQYVQGEIKGNLHFRDNYAASFIENIVEKIERMMQSSLKSDQRRSLRQAVKTIEKEAHDAFRVAQGRVHFDVDGYWKSLVETSEFQFSILGIQRINYGSLFFAYEDFLANAIRTKELSYSSKDRNNAIHVAFPKYFGKSLTDFCCSHDEVTLARLVRNSLAHNGGRFGSEFEKFTIRFTDATGSDRVLLQGERFALVDGKIQITPANTAYLFCVLKERITKIVAEYR